MSDTLKIMVIYVYNLHFLILKEFTMGNPVIRRGVDLSLGHMGFPPVPAIQGSNNVRANSISIVRQGDMYQVHCNAGCHQGIATGSSTVRVNGRGITTRGRPITCGDISGGGSNNVNAGG